MASPPKILPQASVSVIPALSSPRVLQLLNGQLDVGQAPQMTNGSCTLTLALPTQHNTLHSSSFSTFKVPRRSKFGSLSSFGSTTQNNCFFQLGGFLMEVRLTQYGLLIPKHLAANNLQGHRRTCDLISINIAVFLFSQSFLLPFFDHLSLITPTEYWSRLAVLLTTSSNTSQTAAEAGTSSELDHAVENARERTRSMPRRASAPTGSST
ncbi:hypothetical protein PtA15_10A201 [Puccinia triticina]|uniref:Uncharacterized protein n=1 Tax=Puccinia triticina TaxID=208348 RepID=A0ABY7D1E2_9BASI|nr:uncharacterized protein PtA15_10A201 [Puccinia triticina]WAQ88782.1 hypothetical protein PtA15_10A201 [Puccinia triticina]